MSTFKEQIKLMRAECTRQILVIAIISSVGAFTYGYDLNWWGAAIAHPHFNAIFGDRIVNLPNGASTRQLTATQQSIGTAMAPASQTVGVGIAVILLRSWGYKRAMFLAAVIVILGSIVQITCGVNGHRYWQMVAGKCVVTVAVGINSVALPIYLSNVSPPMIRGAMIGLFASTIGVAAIVAALTIYLVRETTGPIVYLLPCGIQMVTPCITLATLFLLPENPHWLVSKGRTEQALNIIRGLRSNRTEAEVQAEIDALLRAQEEARTNRKVSWRDVWLGTNLKRTLAVVGLYSFYQAQGLGFLLSYMAVLFTQLGIKNIFLILVIVYTLVTACTLCALLYQDLIGRRIALLTGGGIAAATMIAFASVVTAYPVLTGAVSNAAVALVMLWFVAFTCTWYGVYVTVTTEIPAAELRDITIGIGQAACNVVNILVTVVSPYLQNPEYANMGGKIAFIYGGLSVAAFAFVWFLVPELKGRSSDHVDYMYRHHVPIRQMKDYVVPPLQIADGDQGGYAGEKLEIETHDERLDTPL